MIACAKFGIRRQIWQKHGHMLLVLFNFASDLKRMLSARAVRNNTDGPAFPTKTPGRDLNSRFENANALATTVHRKGKNVLFPKTPLHPSSARTSVKNPCTQEKLT